MIFVVPYDYLFKRLELFQRYEIYLSREKNAEVVRMVESLVVGLYSRKIRLYRHLWR